VLFQDIPLDLEICHFCPLFVANDSKTMMLFAFENFISENIHQVLMKFGIEVCRIKIWFELVRIGSATPIIYRTSNGRL
jgi:hypothetical protein